MPPAVSLGLMDWTKVSEPKPWSWTQVFLLQTICKARYVFMKIALLHNISRLALPTAPSPKCPWLAEISKSVFEKEIIEEKKKKPPKKPSLHQKELFLSWDSQLFTQVQIH